MEDQGFLYCCTTNIKDHYKIGKTKNLNKRLNQYKTSIINPAFLITCPPCQNNVCFCDKTNKPLNAFDFITLKERAVHKMLKEYRVEKNHEFFKCKIQDISVAFDKVQTMNKQVLQDYLKNNIETPCKIIDKNNNEEIKKIKIDFEGQIEVLKVEKFELNLALFCRWQTPSSSL